MVCVGAQIISKRPREIVNSVFGDRKFVKVVLGAMQALVIAIERLEDDIGESSCVGRPLPGVELKVLDEEGNSCTAGEQSHLYFRPSTLMKSYWQTPTATSEVWSKDGWLDTGDTAYLADDDGRLNLTGRSKEIIKVRGRSANPHGIEETLWQVPTIETSCVVSVSSSDGKELSTAYIVSRRA